MSLAAVYQPYQHIIPPSALHHPNLPLPIQIPCHFPQHQFPPAVFRPLTYFPVIQAPQVHTEGFPSLFPQWNPTILYRPGINVDSPLLLPVLSSPLSDYWVNKINNVQSTAFSEKSLGYGAFGVVWSVQDPRSGECIALKRIPNTFITVISAKRAYRELYMLAHLKHTNIISLVDFVCAENFYQFNEVSILTEFMDTDLHKIIVSPQPLSQDHAKLFFYQVLRGVKYLHSAGIIHRDLKPGNLLVNSNCLVKICDFGLARTEEPNCSYLTQEVITQYYRPPELLMGVTRYSFSVDMWSCGCIFAELLSRRILFQASTPLQQLERIVEFLGTPEGPESKRVPPEVLCYLHSLPVVHKSTLNSVTECQEARALLMGLLRWDPDARLTAEQALQAPFVESGRARFHYTICSCCPKPATPAGGGGGAVCTMDTAGSVSHSSTGATEQVGEMTPLNRLVPSEHLEPSCTNPIAPDFDANINTTYEGKVKLWSLMQEYFARDRRPVRVKINPLATNYRAFVGSSAAFRNGLTHAGTLWR